jgi:hypothetical protein
MVEINKKIDANKAKSREILGSKRARVKEYFKKGLNGFKEFFKSKEVKEKLKTKEGEKEVVEHVAKDVQAKTGLSRNQALKIGGAMLAVYGINALGSYLDEDDKPEDVDIDAILDDIFAENNDNLVSGQGVTPPATNPIDIPENNEDEDNNDNEDNDDNTTNNEGSDNEQITTTPSSNGNPAINTSESPAPETKPHAEENTTDNGEVVKKAKYTAEEAGHRLEKVKDPKTVETLWKQLIASGGNVETKATSAGQEYQIWTGSDGKKLMKMTHSAKRRHKAKAGDEGWFLNRKGGVKKGDVRDILGRENVRRRDIKTVLKLHKEDENGIDTFTRIYRIEK